MNKLNPRIFRVKEQIKNIYYGSKGFVLLRSSKKLRLMNKKLKERIMLAITEVNGCAMCSYVHTKIALSSGMSDEDIKLILDGNTDNIPLDEAVAVMFAQEFASSNENPSIESIERLVRTYGFKKSELILAACHMITMTNGMGISMDSFYNRLKFNRVKGSNILLEILNPLLTMVLFPILTILFAFKCAFGSKPKTLKPCYQK